MQKQVVIASKNPVKINATKIGFQKVFPKKIFTYEGISVPSEVSDQPMTAEETLLGAMNRVKNAKVKFPSADYWVGIEGGIDQVEESMMTFAWIVIQSNENIGKARTASFFLPKKVTELIREGMELGEADDVVFGDSNSKQKGGAVGLLTDNVIDRTRLYEPAVIMALIPFLNPKFYKNS